MDCNYVGSKIRSRGLGRGLGTGRGRGPIGRVRPKGLPFGGDMRGVLGKLNPNVNKALTLDDYKRGIRNAKRGD